MKTLARHSLCLDLVQIEGFFFPPLFHMLQLLHFLTFHLHLVFKYNPYHDVVTRFCVIIQPWIQSKRTDIV